MEENEGVNILETRPVSNGPRCKVRTSFFFNYRKYYIFLLLLSDFGRQLPSDQNAHKSYMSHCKQVQKFLTARLC